MGWVRFSYREDTSKLHPGVRARVEQSRKRFHCDLFEFWRECGEANCRRRHGCANDPFECFRQHHAAMPPDHAHWRQADVLLGTRGTAPAEQALRAFGLSLPGKSPPESERPPQSSQAVEAGPAPVPRREQPVLVPEYKADETDRARAEAEILSRFSPEGIASLEKNLRAIGQSLPPGFGSRRTSPPPSRQADQRPDEQADEDGPDVVPRHDEDVSPQSGERVNIPPQARTLPKAKRLPEATVHSIAELEEALRSLGLLSSSRGTRTDGAPAKPEGVARARNLHRNAAVRRRRRAAGARTSK